MSADGGFSTPLLAGRSPFDDEDNQVGLDFSKLRQVPSRTRTRTRVQDLMHESQIPLFMKRECVVWHYRPQTRFSTAVRSVFRLHNETVNIWSHAIGKHLCLSAFTAQNCMPHLGIRVECSPEYCDTIFHTRMISSPKRAAPR